MKRFRPHCAGYIVLYVLTLLSLADVIYSLTRRQSAGGVDMMGSFGLFSVLIFAVAVCYSWNYARSQVSVNGDALRIAYPTYIKPKQGQARASVLFRQGDMDLKFIDKTLSLSSIVRYGYVEDLGYQRLDAGQSGEKNKLFPVHEVALITGDNKRYHMNAAIFSEKQRREIFSLIREGSGVEPEGKLKDILK